MENPPKKLKCVTIKTNQYNIILKVCPLLVRGYLWIPVEKVIKRVMHRIDCSARCTGCKKLSVNRPQEVIGFGDRPQEVIGFGDHLWTIIRRSYRF